MKFTYALTDRLAGQLAFLALLLLIVAPLNADELLMKDGSRLIGKVVKQEDGTLDFETSYAGTIKVKWDQISELHTEEPVRVMLDNEELYETTDITREDGAAVVTAVTEPTRGCRSHARPISEPTASGRRMPGDSAPALRRAKATSRTAASMM